MSLGSENTVQHQHQSLVEEEMKASGSGTSGTTRFVTFAPEKPTQPPLQSGFSSMKRGITSFMSTMDAALKHTSQIAGESVTLISLITIIDQLLLGQFLTYLPENFIIRI